jgi:hypothetical protein
MNGIMASSSALPSRSIDAFWQFFGLFRLQDWFHGRDRQEDVWNFLPPNELLRNYSADYLFHSSDSCCEAVT